MFLLGAFFINKAAHFEPNNCVVFPSHIDAFMQSGDRSSINIYIYVPISVEQRAAGHLASMVH